MVKLKLSPILEDKPTRMTIELPGALHRELVAYAEILSQESGQSPIEPSKLVVPMIQRFIATDRGFARARKTKATP